jgi:crotonobetaine/carnitine-CoA ligase
VQSDVTEQEVIAFVVERPGERIDPAELVAFSAERMAAFMVPRYVEILDELPKTATEKVAKHDLEARGVGAGTWDREKPHA